MHMILGALLSAGTPASLGREFVLSPGFGGVAAVLAASIAYLAARRSARMQRETARKQQWWDRARWALDLTLDESSTTREVGFGVLGALARSDFAAEHEASVVDAAFGPTLAAHQADVDAKTENSGGPPISVTSRQMSDDDAE